MPWSPYGKTGTGLASLDMLPWRIGVPRAATSGLKKWEGPDPAAWVARGYAVVNIDARGSLKSGGDFHVYETRGGRDGYDSIEWIAKQKWCNEKVGMAGNSWLAIAQWFIAAEQPPHLACIAPWEGLGDFYKESLCHGGIPDVTFFNVLLSGLVHRIEDVGRMIKEHPLYIDYWEDKKANFRNITVPMYATASYSTAIHTEGSVRGFQLSRSTDKWLRWVTTLEWHDIYQPENMDDLQKFFDRYMLGLDNGWEKTPKIRCSLLGYNRPSVVNRPASGYPPKDSLYETLFLDANTQRSFKQQPSEDSTVEYQADSPSDDGCKLTYTLQEYTELFGISKLEVWMSTADHDDMDVYVIIRKLDRDGNALWHKNIPMEDLSPGTTEANTPNENMWRYIGPNGRLRASHREIITENFDDLSPESYQALMGPAYVYHPHTSQQILSRGEVVELEISLWPGGMVSMQESL